ncbi:MAG: acetolactate synthase large subunit [Betaproteobacteria bacterium]|nr:acetolactate synthase large subunit [Betaproteobacteria bacterium]
MNGAESLVHTLLETGVDVCFTNPGTSEMHFVSALDRIPGMRCVLGLFEGVVTGAADGYWRIAERPASTLLHLGPGLGNGLANLHNARKARSGIVNVVGEHATYHIPLNAPLTSDIEGVARPMSHWVHTSRSADDIATDGRAAVAQARTAPGQIATLILPADTAWGTVSAGAAAPRGPLTVAAPRAVADERVAAAAQALGPDTLLLLGGHALRESPLARAGRIAAKTGCAVMSEFAAARVQRGAGRVAALRVPYVVEAAQAALSRFRRIVLVGATPPVAFFAYPDKPSLLAPPACEFITLAEVDEDLDGALAALADRLGASALAPAGVAQARRLSASELPTGAVSSEGVAAILSSLLPENAIVVDESVTFGRAFSAATAGAPPHDWLTGTGGSIGFAMPVAVGAAIAAPDRRVVVLEGDGSGMYTLQALWTMAREGLNATVVVFANRAYQILRGEFLGVGAGEPGPRASQMLSLDSPALDWLSLARGMGVSATRADTLGDFAQQFARSVATPGPTLIELVI